MFGGEIVKKKMSLLKKFWTKKIVGPRQGPRQC